jgi:gluconate kinase
LEPSGEKETSSGTKERLLKCSSLKRTTAEVLSRSAQEFAFGQIQDTGHEGAFRKKSLRRATAEMQKGI